MAFFATEESSPSSTAIKWYPKCIASLKNSLSEPLVLYEGELSSACDCQVEYDNVTRGGLKITREGQQLRGASLIMAGATLLGSRIQIGRSVLIESGAWIRVGFQG